MVTSVRAIFLSSSGCEILTVAGSRKSETQGMGGNQCPSAFQGEFTVKSREKVWRWLGKISFCFTWENTQRESPAFLQSSPCWHGEKALTGQAGTLRGSQWPRHSSNGCCVSLHSPFSAGCRVFTYHLPSSLYLGQLVLLGLAKSSYRSCHFAGSPPWNLRSQKVKNPTWIGTS